MKTYINGFQQKKNWQEEKLLDNLLRSQETKKNVIGLCQNVYNQIVEKGLAKIMKWLNEAQKYRG